MKCRLVFWLLLSFMFNMPLKAGPECSVEAVNTVQMKSRKMETPTQRLGARAGQQR